MRPIEEIACGLWPTARAQDAKHGAATEYELNRKPSLDLRHVSATRAMWPTPRANEGTGDKIPPGRQGGLALKQAVHLWPTPTAQPSNADGESFLRRKGRKPDGAITDLGALVLSGPTPSGSQEQTGGLALKQAVHLWPTPTSRDHKDGPFCPNVDMNGLLGRTVWNGPSEPTEKPGALNPEFVCWLMGFPPEWDACAPTAMPSSRKSRQKS
jgi:hypothetical protein